jgi:hypothetical protein
MNGFEEQDSRDAIWRREIINDGGATLGAMQNVAHGTYGYQVLKLERDGLLVSKHVRGVFPHEDQWIYTRVAK